MSYNIKKTFLNPPPHRAPELLLPESFFLFGQFIQGVELPIPATFQYHTLSGKGGKANWFSITVSLKEVVENAYKIQGKDDKTFEDFLSQTNIKWRTYEIRREMGRDVGGQVFETLTLNATGTSETTALETRSILQLSDVELRELSDDSAMLPMAVAHARLFVPNRLIELVDFIHPLEKRRITVNATPSCTLPGAQFYATAAKETRESDIFETGLPETSRIGELRVYYTQKSGGFVAGTLRGIAVSPRGDVGGDRERSVFEITSPPVEIKRPPIVGNTHTHIAKGDELIVA
eukprot:GDKK01003537.1.p1 GENE.GDKK01003537.1~~GDKK01003537.1.p1  ORF type:complete len:291 (-),score=28.74 GDKK01003537.1:684-1556(-)